MIRVLIATRSGLIGDAMRNVLQRQSDITVVGCARTEEEVRHLVPQCDLLLLTPRLRGANVPALISEMRANCPDLKSLLAAAQGEADEILTYLQAGASGYVLGGESVHSLVKKVRAAYNDKAYVSPDVAAEIMSRIADMARRPSHLRQQERQLQKLSRLTDREEEVLALLNEGCSNKQIAAELSIARGTATNHVHNILKKLDVNSRIQAADIYALHQKAAGSSDVAQAVVV